MPDRLTLSDLRRSLADQPRLDPVSAELRHADYAPTTPTTEPTDPGIRLAFGLPPIPEATTDGP